MITRWNNGHCIGCDCSQGEYHHEHCQEVAHENWQRAEDNLALLMPGDDETARPLPLAGVTSNVPGAQPPANRYVERMIVAMPQGEPQEIRWSDVDVPWTFTEISASYIGCDPSTAVDWSAVAGIRINTDGTSKLLTGEELAVSESERLMRERYPGAHCADCHRSGCFHYGGCPSEKPMPAKTAKDRQLLALLDDNPVMVSDGVRARRGTTIERRLADERTVTKAALARAEQTVEALRHVAAQRDQWFVMAKEGALELNKARAEIAALKATAVSRETPPAPSRADVMGRAIGATLAGWKPVV